MAILDAILAGAGSFLSSSARQDALNSSIPKETKFSPLASGQQDFTKQEGKLTEVASLLGDVASFDNQALQDRLAGIDSTILARLAATDKNASDASQGSLPPEVLRKLQADADYKAFQGGSFGSNFAKNNLKKETELARLKRKSQAGSLAAGALSDAQSLTPEFADVASTLISPAALTARTNAAEEYNADLGNQQAVIDSQIGLANSNALYGGIARGLGGILAGGSTSTKIPAAAPTPGSTNYSSLGG